MQTRTEIIASEFCSSVRDGTHDSPKEVLSGGKPLVTTKHLKGGNIDFDNTYNISEEDFEKINKRSKVDKWDVLISMIGTVGEVYLVDKEPDYAIKNLGLFKVGDEINSKWLYFYLKSKIGQNQIRFLLQGSTQQYISLKSLRGFPLFVPNDDKEKEIVVNFLSALESKIKTNQRMNETLEEIAKTLFKSWFIDFDPVRAKAEGRSTGLSKEISDLFPDSFEDSELGEIPKGWEINKLGHHINLTKGKSYKSAELKESDTALVTLKSFQRNGGYREDGLKEYTGSYKDEQIVSDGDLIVAFTDVTQAADVIGKPAIVIGNPNYSKLVISLDVGVVRVVSESMLTNAFIYFLMLSNRYASNSLGYTNGTNVLHLKKEAITEYDFCLPNNHSLLKIYNDISKNMLEKISKNSLENITLEKLRDTLLPKLISGELKIPDAEEIIEESGI